VNDEDVAAVRMGEDVLVRRVHFKNGSVKLVGDDSSHEAIETEQDSEELDILGPMKGLIRKS
jgi:SOS-response transcriptional repressor LexA